MNTQDVAEQKAYEMLKDLGIPVNSLVHLGSSQETMHALTLATSAFLRGWVHGMEDSGRIRKEILNEAFGEISTTQCTTISHPGTSPTGFRCRLRTGHDGAHDFGEDHARHISLLKRQAG